MNNKIFTLNSENIWNVTRFEKIHQKQSVYKGYGKDDPFQYHTFSCCGFVSFITSAVVCVTFRNMSYMA